MSRISKMLFALLLLSTLAGFVPAAQARPHHHPPRRVVVVAPPRPVVVVRISPWAADYRPDPRPGWHWVPGYYDQWGHYIPGHWVPDSARPGYVWVMGHWVGSMYVEGYWREDYRPGYEWIEGAYDQTGTWIPGFWAPVNAPPPEPLPPPPGPVYHEY